MSTTVLEGRRVRRVPTPEGVTISFVIASIPERLIAFLIDSLIIHVLIFALFAIAFFLVGLAGPASVSLAVIAGFFLRNFYFIFMELRTGGTTIGKRRLGLRVISRDGGPLVAEAIFARNLMRDLEVFLPLLVILQPLFQPSVPALGSVVSMAWIVVFAFVPFFNRERMRCGDLVGGTLVVRAPRAVLLRDLALERSFPTGSAQHETYVFTPRQLDLYGIHELQVLENVLRGSQGFRNRELVAKVTDAIQRKIDWPRAQEVDPDRFLLDFYRAQRARLEQRMLLGERRERKRD